MRQIDGKMHTKKRRNEDIVGRSQIVGAYYCLGGFTRQLVEYLRVELVQGGGGGYEAV